MDGVISTWELLGWGILGGALGDVVKFFNIRQELYRGLPEWASSRSYWAVTSAMALAGGVLVLAYVRSGFTLTPLIALNLGISAPLVLQKLLSQLPPEPGKVD